MHSNRVIIILTLTKQTACKRPRYCSSELNFTWTVQTQSKECSRCGRWREQTWERTDNGGEGLLAGRSVLPSASAFPPLFSVGVLLLSFLLYNLRSSLFLLVFCTSSSLFLQVLYARKWKQRPKKMMSWCGWWCCCGCPSSSFVQLLVRLVVLLRLLFLLVWLLVFEKTTTTVVLRYLFAVSSASVQSASSSSPVNYSLTMYQ